jgi:glycosyltransferase involved in cell wall biosynthesis
MIHSGNNRADFSKLRVAIVHYWLLGHAGGERVVGALAAMFPQADLYAAIADQKRMPPTLRSRHVTTSYLQKIPFSTRLYRHLLLLHPMALEALDLSGYDLIISSESGPAKGVLSPASACHICYCHTPMRYLWDMYHSYRSSLPFGARTLFSLAAHYLRVWDAVSAARVDYFVANSNHVASRIKKHYRRDSFVIHPPAAVEGAYLSDRVEDYYLIVSRLTEYKRVDLAIEACNRLGRRLRIVGDGDQYKRLRRMAGPGIEFLGYLEDEDVHKNYAHCRALLFPGEEDFGLVPVEAHSFGRPVIAFGKGGVLETVVPACPTEGIHTERSTGVFFSEQTPEALMESIRYFESVESHFDPDFIQARARQFSLSRFESEMADFIERALVEHGGLPLFEQDARKFPTLTVK